MFHKGIKFLAGALVGAVLFTSIPAEVFTASEDKDYVWDMAAGFTAGAHHSINETIVLNDDTDDTTDDMLASGVPEDKPLVSEPEKEEEPAPETAPVPEAVPVNPYADKAVAKVNEYLSIRETPNADAKVLGKLYVKGVATVLETLDGWYKIKSGDVTGYAKANLLTVGDEAAYLAAGKRVATTTTNKLNLRKEASTEARVLASISKGVKVSVLDESVAGWVKVKYKTYTGYVSADYVKLATEYTYAESKAAEKARLAAEAAERKRKEEAAAKKKREEAASKKTYKDPTGTDGKALVDYAVQFVGNPYVLGGSSLTKGIDCSNFVMRIYEKFGYSLPHNSYKLRSVGREVKASDIRPGDIVCYQGHVAIYMGNGKIVHAANKKDGIKISSKWNYTKVITIRRVLP